MIAGTIKGRELCLRCPHCGDSETDLSKGHLFVNLSNGLYHCFRCNVAGKLSTGQLLELAHFSGDAPDIVPEISGPGAMEILPGPGSERYSALDRYHVVDPRNNWWDAFEYRRQSGERTGWILRRVGKKAMYTLGEASFLFAGDTWPQGEIRVVEGPYDVIDSSFVAVGGLVGPSRIARMITTNPLVLVPDGDVWADKIKAKLFISDLHRAMLQRVGYISGLWVLLHGKDIDEAGEDDIIRLDNRKEVFAWIREFRKRVD